MRFSATFAALALIVIPAFAAPSGLIDIQSYKGEKTGKYIVKFKAGVSPDAWAQKLGLTHSTQWKNINGLASTLSPDSLNTLRASPDVEYITEDGIVHTTKNVKQTNAPWGISRISKAKALKAQDASFLNYTYTYDSTAGKGVDIYIVDTGIYVEHTQFGGRAKWGFAAAGYAQADGHGHGTHVSGTAAGSQYGVAKAASLIAVKVLDDGGSGSIEGVVSGLDYVRTQAPLTGRPSIVSMSLGGSANDALDDAVAALTAVGVHVAVAAGNSADDAQWYSPARAPSAVTVAASDITDAVAWFSNYGALVDIWAPGVDVISSYIGGPNETTSLSGTSMSTPHISGLIAYLIGKDGNLTPAAMTKKLQKLSVKGVITGVPNGTVNDFAQNV
ncbi:serine protease [Crepidotus variabilis]|uniref:Serine protease n=1 Tax=Crepidotus variabilis TaxID=179855 RepID=A0A9P6E4K1_9AGAR|nr:serine protease [Crepidotus variabilis]